MPASDLPLPRMPGTGHVCTLTLECCQGHIEMVRCGEAAQTTPRPSRASGATVLPPRRIRAATYPPVPIRMDLAPGQHILRRVLDGLKRM